MVSLVSWLTPGSCRARCRPATSWPAWRSPPGWSRRCPPCLSVGGPSSEHSTRAQVCHSHTLSLPSAQVLLLKTGQPWIRSLYFLARHRVTGRVGQEHLPLLPRSPQDSPQVRGGGVALSGQGDDVMQSVVRGRGGWEWVLVLGGCSLTTGNISARYTTRHHTRVTWRPATTLTTHFRLGLYM